MIPGIHNYCDRWCKHCHFTERCTVFAIEDEINEKGGELNVADHLSNIFKITMEMIVEDAEKRGIKLDELDAYSEEVENEMANQDQLLKESPLVRLASSYVNLADSLISKAEEQFKELAREDAELKTLDLESAERHLSWRQAIEAIRWYRFQIVAKISRAITGRASDEYFNEDERDSDGSAKVALIGLERSIAAWKLIYDLYRDEEIFDILGRLTQIRGQILVVFPKAPAFKRPGFDD